MISEEIQKELDGARKFGGQLEQVVVSKNQFPTGDRNVLLIAYWALMLDYHVGDCHSRQEPDTRQLHAAAGDWCISDKSRSLGPVRVLRITTRQLAS